MGHEGKDAVKKRYYVIGSESRKHEGKDTVKFQLHEITEE